MKPAKHDLQFIEAYRNPRKRTTRLKRLYFNRLLSKLSAYLVLLVLIINGAQRLVSENEDIWSQVMLAALLAMFFTISLNADMEIKVLLTASDQEQSKSRDDA
jgi:hypothetical protein